MNRRKRYLLTRWTLIVAAAVAIAATLPFLGLSVVIFVMGLTEQRASEEIGGALYVFSIAIIPGSVATVLLWIASKLHKPQWKDGRCPNCDYIMRGHHIDRCPECGEALPRHSARDSIAANNP